MHQLQSSRVICTTIGGHATLIALPLGANVYTALMARKNVWGLGVKLTCGIKRIHVTMQPAQYVVY